MGLLELPPEIRAEVYYHVFSGVVITIDLVRQPGKLYEQCATTIPGSFNIVLASRQIRGEAEGLFHHTVNYVSNYGISLVNVLRACPEFIRQNLSRLYGLQHNAALDVDKLTTALPALQVLGLNSPVGDVHTLFSDMSMNSVEWGGLYNEQRIRAMTYENITTAVVCPAGSATANWLHQLQPIEEQTRIRTIVQINLMCTTPPLFGYVPVIGVPVLVDLKDKTVTKDFHRPRSTKDLRNKCDMTWVEANSGRRYVW